MRERIVVSPPSPSRACFVCPCVSLLLVMQYSDRARTRAKAKQITVSYGSLLVATGSSVRVVEVQRGKAVAHDLRRMLSDVASG